jgi:hypothetical protein
MKCSPLTPREGTSPSEMRKNKFPSGVGTLILILKLKIHKPKGNEFSLPKNGRTNSPSGGQGGYLKFKTIRNRRQKCKD